MRKVTTADARVSGGQPDPVLLETKYLHLRQPVPLGHRIDGWRVCWLVKAAARGAAGMEHAGAKSG